MEILTGHRLLATPCRGKAASLGTASFPTGCIFSLVGYLLPYMNYIDMTVATGSVAFELYGLKQGLCFAKWSEIF